MSTLTASGTTTLKSVNPATGAVVGEVHVATATEIESVVSVIKGVNVAHDSEYSSSWSQNTSVAAIPGRS